MNKKVIIILIIIFIFLSGGLLLLSQLSKTSQEYTHSPTSVPLTAITETQIGTKVLQFYREYEQFNEGGLDSLYQKGFLIEDAYNTLKKPQPVDPVLCTQGGSQTPVEIDSVTIIGQEATVIVKQYFEGSQSYNYMKVIVRITDQKIMSIMCNYTK